MSVINKMLQDLDARGGTDAPAQSSIRLVAREERRPAPLMLAGAALAIVALAAAGYFGWRALRPASAVAVAAPANVAPVKTVLLAPLPAVAVVPAPVPAPAAPLLAPTAPVLAPAAPVPVRTPVASAAPPVPRQPARADKPPVAQVQKPDPIVVPDATPLT